MVRLKETRMAVVSYTKDTISIPYGAIKRLRNALLPICVHTFQFLMVRLKATNSMQSNNEKYNFNSLWCD